MNSLSLGVKKFEKYIFYPLENDEYFFAILVIVVIVRVDIIIVCVGGCCGCNYNNYNNEIQCIQKNTIRPSYWPFALDCIRNEPNHSCVLRGGRNCKHSCEVWSRSIPKIPLITNI